MSDQSPLKFREATGQCTAPFESWTSSAFLSGKRYAVTSSFKEQPQVIQSNLGRQGSRELAGSAHSVILPRLSGKSPAEACIFQAGQLGLLKIVQV